MKTKNNNNKNKNNIKTIKSGFVGIIGQPNAGKSSFLNRMVAEKVSIVTSKPQTTRRRSLGIINDENYQIVFVDAPGMIKNNKKLNSFLQAELDDVVKTSDVLLAVLSIDEESVENIDEIIKIIKLSEKPWCAFINKTDIGQKAHRTQIIKDKIKEAGGVAFAGTCSHEEGVPKNEIIPYILSQLPESKGPLYDPELFTPHTVRELVIEIVREKCFEILHQEVPYGLAVRIAKFDEGGKLPKISFEILVEKESHKPIVIGKAGATLKEIGTQARKDIEKLMQEKVFIDMHVIVKENWTTDNKILENLGYKIVTK
jgi:GTP-binding protein Era